MARYSGTLGFYETAEIEPGIWEDVITEHKVTGVIEHSTRRYGDSNVVDRDVTVTMALSMIHNQKFEYTKIRYVSYQGTNWAVNTIEYKRPRVVLHFGGVWNGNIKATDPA